MPSFAFIGLGLNDEKSMTVEGLEEARRSDVAFAEFYTSIMPGLDLTRLESAIGKKIHVLKRNQLEEEGGRELLKAAQKSSVAMLVPGDPMIATTHVSLRLSLFKMGIKSRIIHSASIMSAVCGATGLQSYKFGKAVTIPYEGLPSSVLETISDNRSRGLHTLLLLDVDVDRARQLTISDAVAKIIRANSDLNRLLAIGVARIGAVDEIVKVGKMGRLEGEEFGDLPHSLVIVGRLHFMESDALKVLGGAQEADLCEKA